MVCLLGLAAIYLMSQVYRLQTVPIWNTIATPLAFYGTTFLLGGVTQMLLVRLHLQNPEIFLYPEIASLILMTFIFMGIGLTCTGLAILKSRQIYAELPKYGIAQPSPTLKSFNKSVTQQLAATSIGGLCLIFGCLFF